MKIREVKDWKLDRDEKLVHDLISVFGLELSSKNLTIDGNIFPNSRIELTISSSIDSFILIFMVLTLTLFFLVGVWYKKNQISRRKFYIGCDASQTSNKRFQQGKLKKA